MSEASLPLSGVRVLDLTTSWAGPWCTKILGDHGAEVIKVEAVQAYDLTRGPIGREDWRAYAQRRSELPTWERPDTFLKPNRNKKGITLNLKDPRAQDLARRLAMVSDVVAENYAPGEMERFGLGYDDLRALKPSLVLLRMPAIGSAGPERNYVGFGSTIEMLSGLAELTGYEGEGPMKSGFWYGDPISGVHAAGAVMLALLHRDLTGEGQIVEVAQLEALMGFAADGILQYEVNGASFQRLGNTDLQHSPQGVYRCEGEERWVAVSVCEDAQWPALARVIGRPDWATNRMFATDEGRKAQREAIDAAIAAWAAGMDHVAAAETLLAAGVPAGPVYNGRHVYEDPQVAVRGFLEDVEHPVAGPGRYPSSAWLLDGARLATRMPAPMLGQHNRDVLCGILGLSEAEYAALEADNVIGNKPLVDVWGG